MTEQFANGAQSSLSANIDDEQTTIYIADASSFPATPQFRIIVQTFDASGKNPISLPEIMLVTAVGGNGAFTVTRAAEAVAGIQQAYPFRSGALVNHIVTAAVMEGLQTGSSGVTFTDGTHTVSGATQLTITGGTVGGSTPDATLTITASGSIPQASFYIMG